MAQFGELLAELRQDKKMTQHELAEIMHVSTGTISNYENGVHFPDVEKLISLADYFSVTTDYLLGRSISNLSPDIFKELIAPGKTVGDFLQEFRRVTPERKDALLLIMRDMGLGMMVGQYNKKETP